MASNYNEMYAHGVKIGIVEALGCLLDGHSISEKRHYIAKADLPDAPFESGGEKEDFKRGVDEALGVVEVWLQLRRKQKPMTQ